MATLRTAVARLGVLAGLVLAAPARADQGPAPAPAPPPGPALTLASVYGGPPRHQGLPGWAWRPGHATLWRQHGETLEERAPADEAPRPLRGLSDLEALVPEAGPGEEGIGRHGPARLLWAADGRALCVAVRGERVWVPLDGGAPRRLTAGGGPARSDVQISPRGGWISYAAGDDLVLAPTDGGPPRRVPGGSADVLNARLDWVYPEELGLEHAAWWAPDDGRVAFLRLDQAGVPTYDVPRGLDGRSAPWRIRYPRAGETNPRASVHVVAVRPDAPSAAAPGTVDGAPVRLALPADAEYVVRVVWTPDASRVLVATLDRAQQHLVLSVCDPVTGAARVGLEERDAAWIEPPPAPRFVDAEHLLWCDGRGGWWLHRVRPDGALERASEPLAPPGFVVQEVLHAVPGDGAGRAASALARGHLAGGRQSRLWRLAPGRAPAPWGEGLEGSHDADLDDGAGYVLLRRSTALTPPVLEVRRADDGALVRALGDAQSDAYRALELPVVEEGATPTDGGDVLWRLWRPARLPEGRRLPLVLQVYGGPGSRTVEDRFGGGPYGPALWVQRGYLVLQADGRGTGGQGPAFERAVRGGLSLLEVQDLARAVRDVARRPYVDGARVGVFGWSYGGTLAAAALLREPDVFHAAVAVAPVTDWRLYDTIYTERYMGLPEQNPAGYRDTALPGQAARLRGRLLLLHGLSDENVHPANTLQLVEALLAAGRTGFDWGLYPDRAHGLERATLDVFRRVHGWFDAHLAPSPAAGTEPAR